LSSGINPNKVLMGNKGILKINGYELAELKELEIKIVPEIKEIATIDSKTKGKMAVNYNGVLSFELYKVYSRFKPALLECAKNLSLFSFKLEATVYTPDKKYDERVVIDECWLDGETVLLSLKADGDFLSDKFTGGFKIESIRFDDTIDDGNTWSSILN
jgi:hypothetical protein